MKVTLPFFSFDVNSLLAAIALIIGAGVLFFTLGIYITMLSVNYVFYMLHLWTIMSQVITVTFWQTFWLVIAAFIVRYIFFK